MVTAYSQHHKTENKSKEKIPLLSFFLKIQLIPAIFCFHNKKKFPIGFKVSYMIVYDKDGIHYNLVIKT